MCRRYDKECDLWSIGVITFVLLCGYPPFYGETDGEIFASVKAGRFEFRSPEWDPITGESRYDSPLLLGCLLFISMIIHLYV